MVMMKKGCVESLCVELLLLLLMMDTIMLMLYFIV